MQTCITCCMCGSFNKTQTVRIINFHHYKNKVLSDVTVSDNEHKFTSASKPKLLSDVHFLETRTCNDINIAACTANCAENTHHQGQEHKPAS